MPALDIDFVRQQFPALADPALEGWAFFENAGGSYPCRQVVDRLHDFYSRPKVQPHHPYPAAQLAGAAMDDGRTRLASLLGVTDQELFIGPSTTQNTYVLARAFQSILSVGDAIVVTQQDHEANSGCWRRLADHGIEIREWAVDSATGRLDLDDLDGLLDEDVRIVAFPHVSNVVGEVNPVTEICDRAHLVGAWAVVDDVAHAPHRLPAVHELGADVHLFSTYKTYANHQGVMIVQPDLLDQLPNQGHFFNAGVPGKGLVPAGPDHAQVAALGGLADYIDELDRHHFAKQATEPTIQAQRVGDLWRAHETSLLEPLMQHLATLPKVRVLGPTSSDARVPTVALDLGRPAQPVAARLAERRIMCAGSHFYAHRLMTACGVKPEDGVLRFSFVHNATASEIEQLVDALADVLV